MKLKRFFIILFSSVAFIAAAAVVWHVQETEYYKSRLQTNKHPKLWKVLFERRIPKADPLIVGKWQNKENPLMYKVYYDEYDEENKLFWGKEWDESEDVQEEDLKYHGNGWFRWEKRGKNLHEYATMDITDVPIYRGYKVRYLSKDSLAYKEKEYDKKIFCFVRRDNALATEEDLPDNIQEDVTEESKTDIKPEGETDIDDKEEEVEKPEKPVTAPAKKVVASLSVDKTSISAPAEGTSVNITVTCNTEWEIEHPSDSMYSVSSNGNTLTINIYENTSTDSRADFFTVRTKDRTKEQRITLSQNGRNNIAPAPAKTTYNVHDVTDDYTIHGYQITNYTCKAKELKVLRDAISEWGELRTGAISEYGTGIAIYGNGGYQATMRGNEFKEFGDALDKFKKSDTRISDVAFNKDGNYVFILGNYGYAFYGVPKEFEDALLKLYNSNEKILSVSLDDNDNWAYVSAKHFGASDNENYAFMQEASEKYGKLESVCITTKGIVVCCRNGVYFKNVPKSVVDALIEFNNSGMRPKVVKFTDSGTYLITDGESSYTYSM